MYKILISDKLGKEGLALLKQMTDVQFDNITGLPKEELLAKIPAYDALIVRSETTVDADVLQAGVNLKVVGRAGMGVDNIDLDAASKRGIIVMNTPHANSVATAEQTLALMLAISRHTAQSHASMLAGEWQRTKFVGTELYGKTLGVVGFGRIGRLVTERAQSFGMKVIAFDPYVSEVVGRNMNVNLVDLDDLCAQADYITLHSVLTKETEKIIGEKAISQMKDGVVIINVARGKLIDEVALAEALKSGKVRGAALDVFSKEPPQNNPLVGLNNVLHTPHLGASTEEAQRQVAVEIVEQIVDALRGTDYRNALNVPFRTGPDFAHTRPYLALAEKLGTLQAHLAPAPITSIEVEVTGEGMEEIVRAVAASLLTGLLKKTHPHVNVINAPLLAQEAGIKIEQAYDLRRADYTNLITCKVNWAGGSRVLAGVLFGKHEPRLVQIDDYHVDAKPEGTLLYLENQDVPGVIGQVATILATYGVNIGEWRLGRTGPGGKALSFINLDGVPPQTALDALAHANAVTSVKLISL